MSAQSAADGVTLAVKMREENEGLRQRIFELEQKIAEYHRDLHEERSRANDYLRAIQSWHRSAYTEALVTHEIGVREALLVRVLTFLKREQSNAPWVEPIIDVIESVMSKLHLGPRS
jgi:hypothetical protein